MKITLQTAIVSLIMLLSVAGVTRAQPEIEWQRLYESPAEEWSNCLNRLSDGRWLITGGTDSGRHGRRDFTLKIITGSGDVLLSNEYGWGGNETLIKTLIKPTGEFILGGCSDSPAINGAYIAVIENGDRHPKELFLTGDAPQSMRDMVATFDGGYAIVGMQRFGTNERGYDWPYIVKIDSTFRPVWSYWDEHEEGFDYAADEYCSTVELLDDGTYLLAGHQLPFDGRRKAALSLRIDANGQLIRRNLLRLDDYHLEISNTEKDKNGNVKATGACIDLVTFNYYIPFYEIDRNGDIRIVQLYSLPDGVIGNSNCIRRLSDGGFVILVIVGVENGRNADIALLRTDSAGELLWYKQFRADDYQIASDIVETEDGSYMICGSQQDRLGEKIHAMLIKTTRDTTLNIESRRKSLPFTLYLHSLYPNPFNSSTHISFDLPYRSDVRLSIYDLFGREVATLITGELESGSHSVQLSADGFASGVYLIRLATPDFTMVEKMALVR